MTKKLYEKKVMLRECTATVASCEEVDGGWLVELDRTVLFPEGGGQLSDTGSIDGVAVMQVREKEGRVLHLCTSPLAVGSSHNVTLDWQVRLDHMQQHTGEHILSHALWSLFGANNVGFHMSAGRQVTIDMDCELEPAQLAEAENYANNQIWENKPVDCFTATQAEADRLPLRKKTDKVTGELRIVSIEGGDCCTCCGTHLPYTGMVGSVRIVRQERNKGGVRIYFLCGRWALEDGRKKNALLLELGAMLSAKPEELPVRVAKLREDSAATSARLRERTARLWEQKSIALLEQARGGVALAVESDCTPGEAKQLLQQLTADKKTTAIVVYSDGERVTYLIGRGEQGKGDCSFICQLANGLFNGKGGGKAGFAQGSGVYSRDWQERAAQLAEAAARG